MEGIRKPFQGVLNIIRFNWHYFVVSICLIFLVLIAANFFASSYRILINLLCLLAFGSILISLIVSYYVYDLSGLYGLNWLDIGDDTEKFEIININAGFDETSELLATKFVNSKITAFDFYDETKHTEISIKRARKAYPPFPNTQQIETNKIHLPDNSVDNIFLILSAHEIRDSIERTLFFVELRRIMKRNGQIVLTEHLRDVPNFLAYNIGAFHFHTREDWLKNFENAKLKIVSEKNITPFITTFILEQNGDPS